MSSSAITGPILSDVRRSPSGSAAAPSWSFADSTGTGVYLVSAGVLGLSTNGVQRVVVDASGNVGIGTDSPASKLQVSGSGSTYMAVSSANAGSGAGLYMTNSTNSYLIGAGAASGGSGLEFRDVTNSTTRMTLDANGRLLVGGTTGTGTINAKPISTNDNYQGLNAAGSLVFSVTNIGQIYSTSTTIIQISDQRVKENVRDLDEGLEAVMALRPCKFDWKEGKGKDSKNDRGFIAQEFEQVFPDLITTWKGDAPEGEEPYKAINPNLIPVLVKAMQEQQAQIEALKAEVAALKAP